jgi:hypothetical protein
VRCLIVILAAFSPRLALLFIWMFTNLVTRAFDRFLLPLLGVGLPPLDDDVLRIRV